MNHKEYRKKQNEMHWANYLKALDKAKACFGIEPFDWDKCAMALYDAKRELGLCAKTKDVR